MHAVEAGNWKFYHVSRFFHETDISQNDIGDGLIFTKLTRLLLEVPTRH